MKYYKLFLFLLLTIVDISTNAQEVTCDGQDLLNVDVLMGHPGIVSPYKPGHILVFRCTDVNLKMYGQRTIECLSNGKWDNPYPKCGEVTCEGQQLLNVDVLMGHPGIVSPYKPGHILVFRCTDVNLKMYGQRTIECLSNGKWDNPYPKCGGKCGPPPHVNFADTTEITKNEYNSGEKVEYSCFNKYTLVQHQPYSRYLTCEHGEWRGNIKCLKPCSVSVEVLDESGIELRWRGREKIFSPHEDEIEFSCKKGKSSIGSGLRQKCNDGVMHLPRCV